MIILHFQLNTMSPARAQMGTTWSGVERTNHEATTPPKLITITKHKLLTSKWKVFKFMIFTFCCLGLTQDLFLRKKKTEFNASWLLQGLEG